MSRYRKAKPARSPWTTTGGVHRIGPANTHEEVR